MSVKKALFTFLLISFAFVLSAQNSINSDAYPVVDTYDRTYIKTDDGLIAVKVKMQVSVGQNINAAFTNKISIQFFEGEKLNLKLSLVEELDKIGAVLQSVQKIADKVFVFYSLTHDGNDHLYVKQLDLNTGKLGERKLVISEKNVIPEMTRINMGQVFVSTRIKFLFNASKDSNKLLVKYNHGLKGKGKVGMVVLDGLMNILWKENIELPKSGGYTELYDYSIDSDGNGYLLLKKFEDKVPRNPNSKSSVNFSISLYKISRKDLSQEELNVKLDGHQIKDMALIENIHGDMICAGYYTVKNKNTIKGVFVSILDKSNEFSKPQMYDFDLDIVTRYQKLSSGKKKKLEQQESDDELGVKHLRMRDVVKTDDGGLLLAGEEFYIVYSQQLSGPNYQSPMVWGDNHKMNETWYRNNIYVTKINADGELEWMNKIPKKSPVESYRLFVDGTSAYVVFRDNKKNKDIKSNQQPEAVRYLGKGTEVVFFHLDLRDGTKTRKTLFSKGMLNDIKVYQFEISRLTLMQKDLIALELYIKQKQDMMFQVRLE